MAPPRAIGLPALLPVVAVAASAVVPSIKAFNSYRRYWEFSCVQDSRLIFKIRVL